MRISIFGLGYVGAVSGACFAELGHEVVGVDVNRDKIDAINAGRSPIVEAGVPERIGAAVAAGRMRATDDVDMAIATTEVSLVCVGTPSAANGSQSLDAIDHVVGQIGAAIRRKEERHVVVIRSTVIPGTTENRIAPRLSEVVGRPVGDRFDVCFNPEFLREGCAVRDFYDPPFTVYGAIGDLGGRAVEAIYAKIDRPMRRTSCTIAESVKYLSNAYHAVKIVFANEAGSLLKSFGVDGREAMKIFCEDRQLNISPVYLRPGFAFGGSCLPKEVRSIVSLGKQRDIDMPMLSHVIASNVAHIDRAYAMIARGGRRKVALFGLAFKPGTDDLRESPLVALAEKLLGKGFELAIVDRYVELGRLTGANREFIEREIPHLDRIIATDPKEALAGAGVIVVGHAGEPEKAAIAADHHGKLIIDLQGDTGLQSLRDVAYDGICW